MTDPGNRPPGPPKRPHVRPAQFASPRRTAPPEDAHSEDSPRPRFPFGPKNAVPPKPQPEAPTHTPQLETASDMTQGKNFPCENCGAPMKYDPKATALACEYCGHVHEIPQCAEDVKEIDYSAYLENAQVPEEVLAGAEGETRCPGCGAAVVVTAETASDVCPFCGSHLTNAVEAPQPMLRPNGLLPFVIAKKEAQGNFHQWARTRWFTPGPFKEIDKLNKLQGVYLPYWTFDAMTHNAYSGQRGEYYYVRSGKGQSRRTRWYPASGFFRLWFDDVLICASNSLPGKIVHRLEPWDLNGAVSYDGRYLSGFRSERYQVSAEQGFQEARRRMDEVVSDQVRNEIGGDTQRILSVTSQVDGITFKLLLLPVWVAAYRFKGETYRVLVNGRTGEVQGERPYSIAKISGVVALVATIIGFILFLVFGAKIAGV